MPSIRFHSGREIINTDNVIIRVLINNPARREFHLVRAQYDFMDLNGNRKPVFLLQETIVQNDYQNIFYAHFCSFQPNGVGMERIHLVVDYLFTVELTGCSLGFSNSDHLNRQWMAHAQNVSDVLPPDTPIENARMVQQNWQARMMNQAGTDVHQNICHPPQYGQPYNRDPLHAATVTGFRRGQSWMLEAIQFITQPL